MTSTVAQHGRGTPTVLGICGSLRVGSHNARLLDRLEELAPEAYFERYDGLASLPIYNADLEHQVDPSVVDLRARIRAADAVIIASPEYNYSVPGGLKNALDWASRPVEDSCLAGKPMGVIGAAGGRVGSARGQLALRQVLLCTESVVLGAPEVIVSDAVITLGDPIGLERVDRLLSSFWAAFSAHLRANGCGGALSSSARAG